MYQGDPVKISEQESLSNYINKIVQIRRSETPYLQSIAIVPNFITLSNEYIKSYKNSGLDFHMSSTLYKNFKGKYSLLI